MDEWIQRHAQTVQGQRAALVRVCLAADGSVCALFALDQQVIEAVEVRRKDTGGLPRVRGILVARLALREDLRGSGHGDTLWLEVLRAAVEASHHLPARLLLVDAKNERLASWYESHGMIPSETRKLRLYRSISKIEGALEAIGG